jgi:hypothetical protein
MSDTKSLTIKEESIYKGDVRLDMANSLPACASVSGKARLEDSAKLLVCESRNTISQNL